MKIPFLIFCALTILTKSLAPASANLYQNITSVPKSLRPHNTAWNTFAPLVGYARGMKTKGLTSLKHYLKHYGYLNPTYNDFSDIFDANLESAVKTYQLNFNLNPTGKLNLQTLKTMSQPRCGNPDIVNGTSTMNSGKPFAGNPKIHIVAHYSFFPGMPRWPRDKTQFTYSTLPENGVSLEMRAVFSRAFGRWAAVTGFTFTETALYDRADIKIGFYRGHHGDESPFDGISGIVAHSFPPTDGRFHLDKDANWWLTDGPVPYNQPDLESVSVHEIGHLLGLHHSSVPNAVMFPIMYGGVRIVNLADDDICGIQNLYNYPYM